MDKKDQDIILAEGFDEAFLGVGRRQGQPPLAIYSVNKALQILQRQGYTADDAREFFETHSMEVWVGATTPIWVEELTVDELREISAPAEHAVHPCNLDVVH